MTVKKQFQSRDESGRLNHIESRENWRKNRIYSKISPYFTVKRTKNWGSRYPGKWGQDKFVFNGRIVLNGRNNIILYDS